MAPENETESGGVVSISLMHNWWLMEYFSKDIYDAVAKHP